MYFQKNNIMDNNSIYNKSHKILHIPYKYRSLFTNYIKKILIILFCFYKKQNR